jgi:hypothetical protein
MYFADSFKGVTDSLPSHLLRNLKLRIIHTKDNFGASHQVDFRDQDRARASIDARGPAVRLVVDVRRGSRGRALLWGPGVDFMKTFRPYYEDNTYF